MVWARISTLGCISRHLDEDVLHALAREVVLEHRVDLWRRWHTRPEHAPALRDLAGSSATMQSAHPCARKRPASAGGSTSPPPPLRLSATSSPPLPPPPPPPRLPARIAALSRALSVATKTGELPAEARHRITLTAPSTVMRRSVVGTVPGRKAVPAAPSPGRGRGGVDAGRDGPSSRPGLGDECPASNSQPRPHLPAASPGRISRPHLGRPAPRRRWTPSKGESPKSSLRRASTAAASQADGAKSARSRQPRVGAAELPCPGGKTGRGGGRRRGGPAVPSPPFSAGRVALSPTALIHGVLPTTRTHRAEGIASALIGLRGARRSRRSLSPLRLLLAPPLSRVPLERASRRPEWGREWPRGRLWRLTRPTGGPSARPAPPP